MSNLLLVGIFAIGKLSAVLLISFLLLYASPTVFSSLLFFLYYFLAFVPTHHI